MKGNKIKIFLAAYINYPNAQNINCEHIARYLDKDKFEVHTMYTNKLPIDKKIYKEQGVILHRLIHRRYIWFWCKLFTMWRVNADIYYMPKMELMDKVFAKWGEKRNRLFVSSVEGVITKTTNNTSDFQEFHTKIVDSSFAISQCIAESGRKFWEVNMPVLPLGVESNECDVNSRDALSNIVWVGNIKANKRPQYLIECAKQFPQMQFIMIGDGDMQSDIFHMIEEEKIENVILTGRIPNSKVYEYLKKSDLLLMTSEYEGLPKVIQEAAQCGVPSIYINENYSVDFIEEGVNGFGVTSLDEMIEKVQYLLDNPKEYQQMSSSAYQVIQKYTWKNLIKDYEEYFIEHYNKKKQEI